MTKTVCDVCGKEMPTARFVAIENLNFCISSHGKIWDICNECREDLNKWMNWRKEMLKRKETGIQFMPQPKIAHWIKTPNGFKCSNCLIVHSHTSIFCPSCGAKMVEPAPRKE